MLRGMVSDAIDSLRGRIGVPNFDGVTALDFVSPSGRRGCRFPPEYGRSPDGRYPVADEQSYRIAPWVSTRGAEKGMDPARMRSQAIRSAVTWRSR